MEQGGIELLQVLAKKYIWWKAADDPSLSARRVIVQIMNVGDFNDVRAALDMLGPQSFEDALRHAEPGWFSPKSWAYWHYRCGLTPYDQAPPALPKRDLPS